MQDLACYGFHGHLGRRFRRICTGTTRSLRSARLGDRKGRARKDAIFNAKKAARVVNERVGIPATCMRAAAAAAL